MNTDITYHREELTVVHQFNAPKKVVFNAFAEADALAEWWGREQYHSINT